jgi:integrase
VSCIQHGTRSALASAKQERTRFTIQKLAGHSSITISQRYVHADREIKESAIRLLDKLNEPEEIVASDTIEEI